MARMEPIRGMQVKPQIPRMREAIAQPLLACFALGTGGCAGGVPGEPGVAGGGVPGAYTGGGAGASLPIGLPQSGHVVTPGTITLPQFGHCICATPINNHDNRPPIVSRCLMSIQMIVF